MKRLTSLLFTAAVCGVGFYQNVLAQDVKPAAPSPTAANPVQKISPEKLALIREYLTVTNAVKMSEEISNSMKDLQRMQIKALTDSIGAENNELSPEDRESIKRMTSEFVDRSISRLEDFLEKEFNAAKIIEEIEIPIIDKFYTEAEIRDLIAFYKTPTGQKTISLTPKMALETMTALSEKMMPKLQEFLKKMTESDLAELKKKVDDTFKKPTKKS